MNKEPTLEDMWKVIGGYGINCEILKMSNPTEETIKQLYRMIMNKREKARDDLTIKNLKEYIKKMKIRNIPQL